MKQLPQREVALLLLEAEVVAVNPTVPPLPAPTTEVVNPTSKPLPVPTTEAVNPTSRPLLVLTMEVASLTTTAAANHALLRTVPRNINKVDPKKIIKAIDRARTVPTKETVQARTVPVRTAVASVAKETDPVRTVEA
jgi:hypothetical protein